MSQSLIWSTKNGVVLSIAAMTDSHLLNAERMVRRFAVRYKDAMECAGYVALGQVNGSAAEDCLEAELATLEASTPIETLPLKLQEKYEGLMSEIEKRGLKALEA